MENPLYRGDAKDNRSIARLELSTFVHNGGWGRYAIGDSPLHRATLFPARAGVLPVHPVMLRRQFLKGPS